VLASNDATAPVFTVGTVRPLEGSPSDLFSVFVSSDEPLLAPPSVSALFGATAAAFDVETIDGGWWASLTVGNDTLRSGPARLLVEGDDLTGNRGSLLGRAPVFFVDRAPPELTSANLQVASRSTEVALASKLGPLTTASLSLRFNEPLGQPPELRAEPAFVRVEPLEIDGGFARFALHATPDAGENQVEIQAAVSDRFGNRTTWVVAQVEVDDVPPMLTAPTMLELTPFGSSDDSAPSTRLSGASTPGTVARLLDGSGAELARTTAQADGGFVLTLPYERATVRLQLIDEAANSVSPRAADFNRLILVPRTTPNALRQVVAERYPAVGPLLDRSDGHRLDTSQIVTDDSESASSLGGVAARRVEGDDEPPRNCAAVADETRGLSVHFGGGIGVPTADFIEVSTTSRFVRRATEDLPTPRRFASLALDRTRNALVLFGGNADQSVWEFTGSGWTAFPFAPDAGPAQRHNAVMASTAEGVLLIGGQPLSSPIGPTDAGLNDIWLWAKSRWSRVDAGTLAISTSAAAYDPIADKTWVVIRTDTATRTAWYRDGALTELAVSAPTNTGPFAVIPGTRKGILLAGLDDGGARAWTLDLTDGGWATLGDVGLPSPRTSSAGSAWNPQLQRIVWCLNSNRLASYSPFDGGATVGLPSKDNAPLQTVAASYAADTLRGLTVITGSASGGGVWQPSQTWRWDGAQGWRMVSDAGPRIRNKSIVQLEDGGLLAYGGTEADLGAGMTPDPIVYQFINNTWRSTNPNSGPTPQGTRPAVIPFEPNVRVLQDFEWVWSGQAWVRRGATPANLVIPTVLRPPGADWLALLGGQPVGNTTNAPTYSIALIDDGGLSWLSGSDGGLLVPARDPTEHLTRSGIAASSMGGQRHLLFGGSLGNVARNDASLLTLSHLDGGAWVDPIDLADPENDGDPLSRREAAFWWDPTRRAHMLFGGNTSSALTAATTLDTLWALDYEQQHPSMQFVFPLEVDEKVRARVRLRVKGWATGGIRLSLWSAGHWEPVGEMTANNGPSTQSAFEVERIAPIHAIAAPGRRLAVRVEAITPNGQGQSQVAIDSMQATVEW
jgi:hypothetical protein